MKSDTADTSTEKDETTDVLTPEQRGLVMSRIRGKDTKPEMLLRRGLHGRGLRYRLHGAGIPGKPDMVFPKHRAVVFVLGCFWHGHGCSLFKWPRTRAAFWKTKISRNMERDREGAGRLDDGRMADDCGLGMRLKRQVQESAAGCAERGGSFCPTRPRAHYRDCRIREYG